MRWLNANATSGDVNIILDYNLNHRIQLLTGVFGISFSLFKLNLVTNQLEFDSDPGVFLVYGK